MKTTYTYLNDSSFLLDFFRQQLSEQLIKITVLNFQERPLKEIQGKVTDGGSLNINGNSAIRRTCNLTVFIDEKDFNYLEIDGYFSMNKKVKIEVGLKNTHHLYKQYETLWFPFGVFVITGLSSSHNDTGSTISLELKDKMCLLNGDVGGIIPAAVTFHEYEVYNPLTGDCDIERPILIQIIRELVHHYGNEQLSKIIINDLEPRIKQVVKWNRPEALYRHTSNNNNDEVYYSLESTKTDDDGNNYNTVAVEGDIGYIYTDFTYPHNSELIGNAGDSVCTILDNIKKVLGNYEYFYDIDGNFIFQEKKNYLNTSKSTVDLKNMNQSDYLIDRKNGKAVYVFNDNHNIKAYTNAPQYSAIKNDFIVWGMRETTTGQKIPIRYHLAIDKKPPIGNEYKCFVYEIEDSVTGVPTTMYKVGLEFESREHFPSVGEIERVYIDKLNNDTPYYWNPKTLDYEEIESSLETIETKDWRTELFLSGAATTRFGNDSNYYYTELVNEWPKLYDIEKSEFLVKKTDDLDYFLDFIDSTAAISEFSISSIGRRTKVLNDETINCLFESEILDKILIRTATAEDSKAVQAATKAAIQEAINNNQSYVIVDKNVYDNLVLGGSQNSAYNAVRDLLYQHTSYNETITVQMRPMYFLTDPNIRITVHDNLSNIHGDYMINSITIPFGIDGTMNLNCARALERI